MNNSDYLYRVYDIVVGSIYTDGSQPPFNLRKMVALSNGWKPCSDIKSSEDDTIYQEFCKEIHLSEAEEFFSTYSLFYEDDEFIEFFNKIFSDTAKEQIQENEKTVEQETTKDLDKLLTEVNGWFE